MPGAEAPSFATYDRATHLVQGQNSYSSIERIWYTYLGYTWEMNSE